MYLQLSGKIWRLSWPTRIRTLTDRTKICSATVTQWAKRTEGLQNYNKLSGVQIFPPISSKEEHKKPLPPSQRFTISGQAYTVNIFQKARLFSIYW